ncbi:hypothetical protein BJY04DRAFT_213678 [Aspergillus karnatakaensis]|uniref:uncharacterized protein n=1 Tax=Aspergillus karnatakaensis TaxID=1810916 RepID=UPI003CCD5B6E
MPSRTPLITETPLKAYCAASPELAGIVKRCSPPITTFLNTLLLETPPGTIPLIFHLETTVPVPTPIQSAGRVILWQTLASIFNNLGPKIDSGLIVHFWLRLCDKSWIESVTSTAPTGITEPPREQRQVIHISFMFDIPSREVTKYLPPYIQSILPTTFRDDARGVDVDTQSSWRYQDIGPIASRTRYRLNWFDLVATAKSERPGSALFGSTFEKVTLGRAARTAPAAQEVDKKRKRRVLSVGSMCDPQPGRERGRAPSPEERPRSGTNEQG